ncbi:MAG: acyl-CoA desaturase [Bacteroidales bacterium]|nr:acyl-CoA desaturase [Bacteroidales bacterium]
MSTFRKINFNNSINIVFTHTLRNRVDDYFKTKGISKHGNIFMYLKTLFMFTLYFAPYFLIITQTFSESWINLILVMIMGLGAAGIGLSVMHDAVHGAYSKNKLVNKIFGYTLNLIGGNAINWKIQHNVLHHSYTNIDGADEDISPAKFLRFSPHAKWLRVHKYQYLYAWFFYGLMSLFWVMSKDLFQIIRYQKMDLISKHKTTLGKEITILVFSKIIYFFYIIGIPLLFTSFLWWQILLGFFVMHFITGFVLAIIFQPAHVLSQNEYPVPGEQDKLDSSWVIHQLSTTADFGQKSRIFSWFVGGLNFQVEHHLFPAICHIHYKKIAEIVQKTAQEFQQPYHNFPTFLQALLSHGKMLKLLGKPA